MKREDAAERRRANVGLLLAVVTGLAGFGIGMAASWAGNAAHAVNGFGCAILAAIYIAGYVVCAKLDDLRRDLKPPTYGGNLKVTFREPTPRVERERR